MPSTIQFMLRPVRLGAWAATVLALALSVGSNGNTQAEETTAASPVGTWQTIDDHTGQAKALVQITQEADGTLSGKVIKGLEPGDDPSRRCSACTDTRKGQLMLGMTIIDGLKQDGSTWDGGHILDPENGKLYRCKMYLADDGKSLVVRGYIGISLLGRSQTWRRN
jgi:uncharacterized protein (DUF2147 family)